MKIYSKREKYRLLRDAGFSSVEANNLMGRSIENVKRLCNMNIKYLEQLEAVNQERDKKIEAAKGEHHE